MNRSGWWLLAGLILLALSSCSFAGGKLVDADQPAGEVEIELEPGQPVGQTFVARHGGLAGVEFFLRPAADASVTLTLHLVSEPDATAEMATASLQLPAGDPPGFYRFPIPYRQDSHGQYYYAFLEAARPGVALTLAGGDTYLDGAAYQSHQPLEAQTRFRLVYAPEVVALDLAGAMLKGIGLLVIAGLLFVLPGWALLAWLLPVPPDGAATLSWAERLGLAAGISLAFYPLLLLWTDLVGLHLGAIYAWLPAGTGLLALAWHHRHRQQQKGRRGLWSWCRPDTLWPDLILVVILVLVFGVRLMVVRSLDAPLWGDSYQHTVITQLLLDHGGLFDSWEPYTPYQGLTVHFGFSVIAALLSWAGRLDSSSATLLTGQLLNGLAALTLYPLSVRLADGKRWAGVGAVLTAGLLSPMPAYYVNWGRYAQLGGQVILPVALWLMWETAQGDRSSWKVAALAGGTAAGMSLTYYRMPLYYGPFVLAWLLGWALSHWKTNLRYWLNGLARLALVASIALLFLFPWGPRVAGGHLAMAVETGLTAQPLFDRLWADYQNWRDLTFYLPLPLLASVLIALGWSLVQRHPAVMVALLWGLGLASLVAAQVIHLPGVNMVGNFAVLIALYLPASLAVGWLIGQIAHLARQRAGEASQWTLGLLLVGLALGATPRQMRIVDPAYILVTRPDIQAMAWIRENTPPEARFLVEGFRIYSGYSAVGADAGWWIPLLTGRENSMPPQYALLNETPKEPHYTQQIVELVGHLEKTSPTSPTGIQLLCDRGITHVYIGQGQGKVGAGAVQLFSPESLAAGSAFRQVYHRDRVYIFALNPQACRTDN